MDRWKGKVAVVTGASAGIGAAICEDLVDCGLKVVGLARRKHKVEELAKKLQGKSGKLYAVEVDVTKEEDILSAFSWIKNNVGHVHILVNSAGVYKRARLLSGSTENWKLILETNVLGLCIATREAGRLMIENHIDGHIIHINSVAGHITPTEILMGIYPPSKFAVTSLTETLRCELKEIGSKIKISSISPALVKTEMLEQNMNGIPKGIQLNPLEAKDISDIVRFVLATPPRVQIHEIIVRGNNE